MLKGFGKIQHRPIFLEIKMDFHGNKPIRVELWNDVRLFAKQKHMIK
jgi:hypothetical protein